MLSLKGHLKMTETTLSVINPTADRTIDLADSSGTLIPFDIPSTTTISATPEELNLLSGTVLGTASANDNHQLTVIEIYLV